MGFFNGFFTSKKEEDKYTPTSFQQTIDLMAAGQLKPQGIITSQIELDEIVDKGFEALTNDKSQAKILVKLSGEM